MSIASKWSSLRCRRSPFPAFTPGTDPRKSYSIHTIERVKAISGMTGDVFFVIGADAFAEIRAGFAGRMWFVKPSLSW
jgi:hypothetical protein